MEYQEIIKKIRPEMDKAIGFLEKELQKIRTGRASPSLVEDIMVDCFGQKMPLKQLAAISVPEARQILIQPWDKSYLEGIERALSQASIGAKPVVDKEVIRLTLPAPTEEFRRELLRVVSQKQEQTRQTLRRWREEAWREIQDRFREGKIREDDKFRGKDELQELMDEYQEKIEALVEKKRKEIIEL